MSNEETKPTAAIPFGEHHDCTYGMDTTITSPSTKYEDLELELNPDPTPHDDWQDKEPCTQRCWKSHRRTQCHNPEPSAKKEQI